MASPIDLRLSAVVALFLGLTLIATYAIVVAPASYAFFTHSDAQLNMWIMVGVTRLMDGLRDHFDLNTRLLLYAPVLTVTLGLAWSDRHARIPDSERPPPT